MITIELSMYLFFFFAKYINLSVLFFPIRNEIINLFIYIIYYIFFIIHYRLLSYASWSGLSVFPFLILKKQVFNNKVKLLDMNNYILNVPIFFKKI